MTPHGNAENTQCSHANFERVFNLFLACAASISDPLLRAKAGKTFDDMPAEVACNQAIYNFYATYLVYTYTIQTGSVNAGSSLDHTTAKSYWSGIINRANVKWNVPGACDAALQVREPAR